MADEATPSWGVVPDPIRLVLSRLEARLEDAVQEMATVALVSDTPKEHNDEFRLIAHGANVADHVSTDFRSVFNAYVHRFHRPKPSITDLARAQDTVIQAFARRYTTKTVAAVAALLSATPNLQALQDGIPSLGFEDYWGLTTALDGVMTAAAKDTGFVAWPRSPR